MYYGVCAIYRVCRYSKRVSCGRASHWNGRELSCVNGPRKSRAPSRFKIEIAIRSATVRRVLLLGVSVSLFLEYYSDTESGSVGRIAKESTVFCREPKHQNSVGVG